MALTQSNMFPLQSIAPDFCLIEPMSGKSYSLKECAGRNGLVVIFMCNHCPFVIHVLEGIVQVANDYLPKDIGFVGISSNDVTSHPSDGPEQMSELAKNKAFPFPYLYDESQAIAKAYEAACTPDFYLFNADLKCVYRGQMDDARPGNSEPVDGKDLRTAIEALLSGTQVTELQKPSMGCNIKWKS